MLALALGLLGWGGLRANQDQQPVFRTSATMVTVDAVVMDKDGHHVVDLTASDFEILQSGEVQSLQHALHVPLLGRGHGTASGLAPSERPADRPAGRARDSRQTVAGPISVGKALRARAAPAGRTVAVVVDDLGMSFESPWSAVRAKPRTGDTRVIPIAGRLSLGHDVPHGPYTLQVCVSQNDDGRHRMRADGWVDLEVQ